MNQVLQQKKGLIKDVFNKVSEKYDIMNDLMSLGIHRIWKKNLIQMMNPSKEKKLIDVSCGTGDITKLYIKATKRLNIVNHSTSTSKYCLLQITKLKAKHFY